MMWRRLIAGGCLLAACAADPPPPHHPAPTPDPTPADLMGEAPTAGEPAVTSDAASDTQPTHQGAVDENIKVPGWLVALDERLQRDPLDAEGQRARVVGYLELGMYERAFRGMHVGLYVMAQHEQLPPASTWLELVDAHFDPETHAAEGTQFLSILDDYYFHSPQVADRLVDYLLAEGRTEVAAQLLREYIHEFPNDPTWAERLTALDATSDTQKQTDDPPAN